MNKSVAVIGLGKYGKSLAENLYLMGADVLAVDRDENVITEFAGKCTSLVRANVENEEEVAALGLKDMDIVVSSTGTNLAAAIMTVAVAKEEGVPLIVAKSSSEIMSSILNKIGVNKIIDPEGEGGKRSARILLSSSLKDYFEIDDNLHMAALDAKEEWVGKTLAELQLRRKYKMNVIATRQKGEKWHFIAPDKPISKDDLLLIALEKGSRGEERL